MTPAGYGAKNISRQNQIQCLRQNKKIGVTNKQGWTAYYLNGELLIKRFGFNPNAVYPDYGCNNEIYINGNFLEIETLGSLTKIPPGEAAVHTEHWQLTKAIADESEQSIDTNILPLVNSFQIPR